MQHNNLKKFTTYLIIPKFPSILIIIYCSYQCNTILLDFVVSRYYFQRYRNGWRWKGWVLLWGLTEVVSLSLWRRPNLVHFLDSPFACFVFVRAPILSYFLVSFFSKFLRGTCFFILRQPTTKEEPFSSSISSILRYQANQQWSTNKMIVFFLLQHFYFRMYVYLHDFILSKHIRRKEDFFLFSLLSVKMMSLLLH